MRNRRTASRYLSIVLGLTLGSASCTLWAQSARITSSTDGQTPLALEPGTPLGSYSLSDLENINLFNGQLNFRLPLQAVTGRGDGSYTIMLPIGLPWLVSHVQPP